MSLFAGAVDLDAIAIDDGVTRRTFREIEARVPALARCFYEDLGLAPGDHVAVHLRNRTAYAEIVLASIAAGLWITPVNWHLSAEEIAYVLEDSGAKMVFVDSGTAPRGAGPRRVDVDALSAGVTRSAPPLDLSARPGGTMIYTSGTSGRPKGVKRARAATLGDALASMRAGGTRFGLDGRGPHLVTGPMYHAAPLLFAIYDLLNGAKMVIMPRWDEREALRLMSEHQVRHAHFVPTMFVRLMRLPPEERRAFDPSTLTLVLHGAAPITTSLKRAMIEWWGPVLTEYWGATEGGIYTLARSEEWLAREGTVGSPVSTFEIFAVGEDGERLGPNEIGTLYCRHRDEPRPFEYHGDEEKTEGAYRAPHVFTAFDLGHVDEDGFVFLSARRSNLILRGGVNIYPAEVERAIAEHEAVADVVVFGVPDEEWGERVEAAVELAPGSPPSPALAAEISSFVAARLARFKVPDSISFVARIPRNEAGKIRREEIERLRKDLGSVASGGRL
jgi:long-chain acyl-CoA synthetase